MSKGGGGGGKPLNPPLVYLQVKVQARSGHHPTILRYSPEKMFIEKYEVLKTYFLKNEISYRFYVRKSN